MLAGFVKKNSNGNLNIHLLSSRNVMEIPRDNKQYPQGQPSLSDNADSRRQGDNRSFVV